MKSFCLNNSEVTHFTLVYTQLHNKREFCYNIHGTKQWNQAGQISQKLYATWRSSPEVFFKEQFKWMPKQNEKRYMQETNIISGLRDANLEV